MRTITFAAGLALLTLAIGLASAQSAPATQGATSATTSATAWDLAALEARVVARSASVRKAGLATDSALLAEKGQRLSSLPGLSAQGGATLSQAPSLQASLGLSAQAKLYDGGAAAVKLATAGLDTETARLTTRSATLAAIQSADQAYYAVLEADAALAAAGDDLAASRLALELAEGKLAAGTGTKADVLKARSDLAAKESAQAQATMSRKTAMAKLASLAGIDAGASLAPADLGAAAPLMERVAGLDEGQTETLVQSVLASAMARDPALQQAAVERRKAALEIAAAKAARLPTVSAGLSVSAGLRDGFTAMDPLATNLSGSLSLSASLPLDLWNSSLAVEKAKLAARTPELEATDAATSLELEVRSALYAWISQAQTQRSSASAWAYASANYADTLELYRLQSATQSELATARTLVSSARRQLDGARYAFLSSACSLKALAGLDTDSALGTMVP